LFSFTKLFRSRDAKAAAAAEAPAAPPQPTIYARADHPVSRSNISPAALKVLYRLKDSGYQGFLVGGAVRDLLLNVQPKDFDIATDAHPEDVRRTFRNCRLIGRRFHLAHVRFGHEIIEVATFRARTPRSTRTTASMRSSTARSTSMVASCATTSTARSKRTYGAATSPPTRSTTTSRITRSGITWAASKTRATVSCD
jgi:hypothetical protein